MVGRLTDVARGEGQVRAFAALVGLAALLLMAAAPAADGATSARWQLRSATPPGQPLRSFTRLRIVEMFRNQAPRYGEREYGINLVWGSPNVSNAYFVSRAGRARALRYGEPLALHIEGGGFVRYLEREYGINLGWSPIPRYEWILRGRGKPVGSPVRSSDRVALYNVPNGKYVLYGEREYGINLVWSTTSANAPTTATVEVAVRIGPFSGAGVPCAGAVEWNLSAIPGSFFEFDGRTTPLNSINPFSLTSGLSSASPRGYFCTFSTRFFSLRPAVWVVASRVTDASGNRWWSGSCNATLNPTSNRVHFAAGRVEAPNQITFCTQDASFPSVSG
jgi:hypothetical protein